jgi:hypothetical protein
VYARLLKIAMMLLVFASCVHQEKAEVSYGINPARRGFVPARIALLPCIRWPDRSTRIKNVPIINRPETEISVLCEDLDKYVADGFDNQPFMKGLSAKLVEKLSTSANLKPSVSEVFFQYWKSLASDCQDCTNLPTFYERSIMKRTDWQVWLTNISNAAKGADAVLIPFVLSSSIHKEDDRGVLKSIRSGNVGLLLLDTNDGSIIWSQSREAEVVYKTLSSSAKKADLPEPPYEDIRRRLLTEAIWLEFPGRQVYR